MSDKNDDDHENGFVGHDDENVARPSTVSKGFDRGDPGLEKGEPESHLGVDCCSLWSKQRTKAYFDDSDACSSWTGRGSARL